MLLPASSVQLRQLSESAERESEALQEPLQVLQGLLSLQRAWVQDSEWQAFRVQAQASEQVLRLLQDTCRQKGRTVIVITHNSALAAMADRVIHINSGQVVEITRNAAPVPVERIEW